MYFLLPVINKYRKKICINFTLLFPFVCVCWFLYSQKKVQEAGGKNLRNWIKTAKHVTWLNHPAYGHTDTVLMDTLLMHTYAHTKDHYVHIQMHTHMYIDLHLYRDYLYIIISCLSLSLSLSSYSISHIDMDKDIEKKRNRERDSEKLTEQEKHRQVKIKKGVLLVIL